MNAHRYTLTVPTYDNNGASLLALHDEVRARLGGAFDGFTVTAGRGVWRGCDEAVRVYTVDVPLHGSAQSYRLSGADDTNTSLYELAEYVAREARQDAVYLTRQPIETWLITAPGECVCGAVVATTHHVDCPAHA